MKMTSARDVQAEDPRRDFPRLGPPHPLRPVRECGLHMVILPMKGAAGQAFSASSAGAGRAVPVPGP
jgi:hypothetical protein